VAFVHGYVIVNLSVEATLLIEEFEVVHFSTLEIRIQLTIDILFIRISPVFDNICFDSFIGQRIFTTKLYIFHSIVRYL